MDSGPGIYPHLPLRAPIGPNNHELVLHIRGTVLTISVGVNGGSVLPQVGSWSIPTEFRVVVSPYWRGDVCRLSGLVPSGPVLGPVGGVPADDLLEVAGVPRRPRQPEVLGIVAASTCELSLACCPPTGPPCGIEIGGAGVIQGIPSVDSAECGAAGSVTIVGSWAGNSVLDRRLMARGRNSAGPGPWSGLSMPWTSCVVSTAAFSLNIRTTYLSHSGFRGACCWVRMGPPEEGGGRGHHVVWHQYGPLWLGSRDACCSTQAGEPTQLCLLYVLSW